MRILIDGHILGENEGGLERYTKNIIVSMAKICPIGVILYKKFDFSLKKKVQVYSIPNNDFFRLFIIPFIMIFDKYDTYISSYAVPLFKPWGKKYITTLHDVSYISQAKFFSTKDQLFFKTFLPLSLSLADIIIVPSNFVKKEVNKWYPQYARKIRIVHEGVDPELISSKMNDKTTVTIRGRYFLCLNSKNQRKNINLIIKAFHQLTNKRLKLIIVGGNKNIRIKPTDKRIKILPYVSDRDLSYLYKNAHALIYYSSYEGFGLPVIESIANNTPVIASDIPCLREINKKHIIFVPPNNLAALSKVLKDTVSKPKEKIKFHLGRFPYSWERAVKKIIEIINSF